MAKFVQLWEARHQVVTALVAAAREADCHRVQEYRAAVVIQSWFRGCRVRAYLRYLHECAVVVQRNFRAYLGRELYRQRLRECLREMRQDHYYRMATKIQSTWRGYFVRKYVFNYYAQKDYLNGLVRKNEIVRAGLESYWQRVEEERLQREEQVQELQMDREARRHHYMLSTQCMDGVFKPSSMSAPLPFEGRMRGVRFVPGRRQLQRPVKRRALTSNGSTSGYSEAVPMDNLPSLGPKVQGPFRPPQEVWRQRQKPPSPTLRVATAYNSQEVARAELKAQEWRSRVIDEKFLPFSRRELQYQPQLHTQSPYTKPPYGTRWFRDEEPLKNTARVPFRTVVPPIPVFERLNSTY